MCEKSDEKFNLGFKVDIELEFKTTRLNGILLSLSNGSDSEVPSLSIELYNGDVIASVDIGEGPFRAVKRFDSKYDMCDGKWHMIKVQYAKSSVTLKVDKHDVSYGLKEKEQRKLEPYTSAPLYIGGLPGIKICSSFFESYFHSNAYFLVFRFRNEWSFTTTRSLQRLYEKCCH